ncbi:MAG: ABC transporter ATP-binding protein [Planctomycetaceae bacterium]|nr:ABC transporter ATP-binding protein [Planctomycetaceae bacterium]
MAVIEVEELEKQYKSGFFGPTIHALKGVSLHVEAGEIFGLLGPNGAGKTTLIKILLGIVGKTRGKATMLGEPAGSRRSRVRVGYLPEHHRIPHHLTGNTALEYYGCLSGMSVRAINEKREALLETVGLRGRGQDRVNTYSKGMLQRLGLAQAMLHDPDLIILDEPTDGVDPVGRSAIRRVLKQIKDQGKTIFLNSHLLQEVELVSDRVAILDRGEVKLIAGVQDLTSDQKTYQLSVVGGRDTITSALEGRELSQWQPGGENVHSFCIGVEDDGAVDYVVDQLRKAGVSIRAMSARKTSLEDAFIDIVEEAEVQRAAAETANTKKPKSKS